MDGALDRSSKGTACFRLKWELASGEFQGRHLISRHWLSPKAIGRTKGDLQELGIGGEHLRGAVALPDVTAELKIVHRADDDGDSYQEIRRIRKIDDTASVDGTYGANGAGVVSTHDPQADTPHTAGETLPDDGAAPSGDDEIMDREYIDFSGKE